MNHYKYIESNLEEAILEWFEEDLGYSVAFGPDIAPDGEHPERQSYKDVILIERLRTVIDKINPNITVEAKADAIDKLKAIFYISPDLVTVNKAFHKILTDGIDISVKDTNGIVRFDKVYLFDFKNLDNNDWLVVNQFTIIQDRINRRPDIIVFINGLPLAIFELKNLTNEETGILPAYNQIQTYKKDISTLFSYNELCILSDGLEAKIGSFTAGLDRFMNWKTIDGTKVVDTKFNGLEILLKGVFDKNHLLDIIKSFIVFEKNKEGFNKKIAGYHQYCAVNKAVERTLVATNPEGDKRCGVVWHTQGSGKSLTMVFYAARLIQILNNPTIVVLTDRNDLDDQLFDSFVACQDILRETPQKAKSRTHLRELLKVASGGIVFTTIQKFLVADKSEDLKLSDRRNIVVIADEAHRSQYDFIDGYARAMRDALPNASFIGFTGTPIEKADANTRAVFGDYIDIYDIAKSVEDKATVPIYYEARLAKIKLLDSERPIIDKEFEELTEGEEIDKKEKLKSKWARLEAMVGSKKRIKLLATDIVEHFENRLQFMDGKGIIVTMSRRIAVELYNEIAKLRPQWISSDDKKGFLKVIMTGSASDPLDWQQHIRTKDAREDLANRMRDANDSLKLVIVRDMWLTGFDVPSLHTMYLDKPMKGHTLMQAIARVNRVYKDKKGGLIVDYLGIAPALKEALSYYTENNSQIPVLDQEEAVSAMLEKYEIVKGIFYGYDYSSYFSAADKEKTSIISGAIDYILSLENGKKRYLEAVHALQITFALAVPNDEALKIEDEVGLFLNIRAAITKLDNTGVLGGPTQEDYDQAVEQMISTYVVPDKVINVFEEAGIKSPDVSILSDEFLADVQRMKHQNIALEILQRVLRNELKTMEKKFLVKSRSFQQMLENTIRKYQNQTIETAQVIAELVELAKKIRQEKANGVQLGLSQDEEAFYDALCNNESAVMELGDETLKTIARELVINIRQNVSIDWTLKENVQAKLRVKVKQLLNKYHYPPDQQTSATQTVLEQANLLCRDWATEAKV